MCDLESRGKGPFRRRQRDRWSIGGIRAGHRVGDLEVYRKLPLIGAAVQSLNSIVTMFAAGTSEDAREVAVGQPLTLEFEDGEGKSGPVKATSLVAEAAKNHP